MTSSPLDDLYDPEAFRDAGHRVVDLLADQLARSMRREGPVLPARTPADVMASVEGTFSEDGDAAFVETLRSVVEGANHLHHPGYVGHQISVPMPQAALAEMVSAMLSNGMAVVEMGPVHSAMERRVIAWLLEQVGFGEAGDGVLTHGGTLGNLTALLAARRSRMRPTQGSACQPAGMAVLVSEQAHYSMERATLAMGWGDEGAVRVPADDAFHLRLDALEERHEATVRAGRDVVAVVASSCTTATGSFDPIEPIADFCERRGIWLHVDAAHGGSFVLSPTHRHRLAGIERADSVVWDLHKMMGLPALNTAVLFRDRNACRRCFVQDAEYLFAAEESEDAWVDLGRRTFECTKRGMGVTAYAMLKACGTAVFAENVDRLAGLTRDLAEILEAAPDFEVATAPEANILCFRHRPPGVDGADLDAWQTARRRRVLAGERFYLVQTRLRDATWLRVTIMNPLTTRDDLAALVDELRRDP